MLLHMIFPVRAGCPRGRWQLATLLTLLGEACGFLTLQAATLACEPKKVGPDTTRPGQPATHVVRPLDVLVICSPDALPDDPINGAYLVEPEGSVNLGPPYSRVKAAGMTCEQVQDAVQKWLGQWVRNPHVYLRDLGPAKWRSRRAPPIPYKIGPNDLLKIHVQYALPKDPIDGEYRVAADGAVLLGKTYGRAMVKGLTLEQAEKAIDKTLQEAGSDGNFVGLGIAAAGPFAAADRRLAGGVRPHQAGNRLARILHT